MDKEEVRQAIVELFQFDSERGRTWFFPRNVSNKYIVAVGLTAKQLAITIATGVLTSGLLILLFRKSTILYALLYLVVGILTLSCTWFFFIFKPITARENISVSEYIRQRKEYKNKQRAYYLKPKKQVEKT